MRSVHKIVSGGQTGVDLAAWDVAREFGICFGGYVPAGRMNEAGPIPPQYGCLPETASAETDERTRKNVETSDATLIVFRNNLAGGTLATLEHCIRMRKPFIATDLTMGVTDEWIGSLRSWLERVKPKSLNVAGPRHSEDPAIYSLTR